jgi:hypothetical protein
MRSAREADHGMSSAADDLIRKLDGIDGSDPELAHLVADDLIRDFLPEEVRQAYDRVASRCRWWAFA